MHTSLPNRRVSDVACWFQLSAEGVIVTSDGYRRLPVIVIDPQATAVTVNVSCEVIVKLDGQVDAQIAGQFDLATFANEPGLEAMGDNSYMETTASGVATTATPGSDGFGTLRQGFLETSNVNVVAELTNLITAQRAYEMNSKVIQRSEEHTSELQSLMRISYAVIC